MTTTGQVFTYHYASDAGAIRQTAAPAVALDQYRYTFENFFHPYVGELIARLNQTSVAGMLDPAFLSMPQFNKSYDGEDYSDYQAPPTADSPGPTLNDKNIDLSPDGPYGNYNWELLYHIPVAVAVHLSNQQRFAEAQRWFHLVFDPTCTDTTVSPPQRFWKFLKFRQPSDPLNIATALQWLSTSDGDLDDTQRKAKLSLLNSYQAILQSPFNPHAVARARQTSYQ